MAFALSYFVNFGYQRGLHRDDGNEPVTTEEDRIKIRDAARIAREKLREEQKKKRQSAALRANLAKRKAQTRARREGEADQRSDGLPVADALPGADNTD